MAHGRHTDEERTPLLHRERDSQEATRPTVHLGPFSFAKSYLVLFPLFANTFATTLMAKPNFDLMRTTICRMWYVEFEPDKVPSGPLTEAQCDRPEMDQAMSDVKISIQVYNIILALVAMGAASYFSNKRGRKPVLVTLLTFSIISTLSLLAAFSTADGWQETQKLFIAVHVWMEGLGSIYAIRLVASMFITDLESAHERTSVLSIALGVAMLGAAPTFGVARLLEENSTPFSVAFAIRLAVALVAVLYTAIWVPESLSKEERAAITADDGTDSGRGKWIWNRTWKGIKNLGIPIRLLKPTRNPQTGGLNFRLLLLAVLQGLNAFSIACLNPALLGVSAARLNLDANDMTGVFSAYTLGSVFALVRGVPALCKWLRPSMTQRRGVDVETADDDFDKLIAFMSGLIQTLGFVLVGVAPNKVVLIISVVIVALGQGLNPAFSSMAASSVSPLRSAKALSALYLFLNIATIIATLTFEPMLDSTLKSVPHSIFWIAAAIVFVQSALTVMVRDVDRHVSED